MVGPTVSGEVAWNVPATVRQDRWLSKTEPGLQTRLYCCGSAFCGAAVLFSARAHPAGRGRIGCSGDLFAYCDQSGLLADGRGAAASGPLGARPALPAGGGSPRDRPSGRAAGPARPRPFHGAPRLRSRDPGGAAGRAAGGLGPGRRSGPQSALSPFLPEGLAPVRAVQPQPGALEPAPPPRPGRRRPASPGPRRPPEEKTGESLLRNRREAGKIDRKFRQ